MVTSSISTVRRVGTYALAFMGLEIAVILALGFFPFTRKGWALLLVLGPPIYWLGELLAERVFASGTEASSRPWPRLLRAVTVVVAGALLVALVAALNGIDVLR